MQGISKNPPQIDHELTVGHSPGLKRRAEWAKKREEGRGGRRGLRFPGKWQRRSIQEENEQKSEEEG